MNCINKPCLVCTEARKNRDFMSDPDGEAAKMFILAGISMVLGKDARCLLSLCEDCKNELTVSMEMRETYSSDDEEEEEIQQVNGDNNQQQTIKQEKSIDDDKQQQEEEEEMSVDPEEEEEEEEEDPAPPTNRHKRLQTTNSNTLQIDPARLFICGECGKGFTAKQNLKHHLFIHNDVRPFQCNECPMAFKQVIALNNHILRLHQDERSFECPKCPKTFKTESNLCLHQKVHKEPQFACEFSSCNKKFRWQYQLKKHQKESH